MTMNLDKINFNVIHNFLDDQYFELSKKIAKTIDVQKYDADYSGKRCDVKNRYFITKDSPNTHQKLADYIVEKYSFGYTMRIEICNDSTGFWLKPHCDHPERLQSYVIYISESGPATTFYDTDESYTIEWSENTAVHFKTQGLNTYDLSQISHGVEKNDFKGVRTTIIATCVDPKTWNNLETCYNI